VYSKAPSLKNWFKKVRIDSFSKGSVLVDYFVELADIPKNINTLEIRNLFHEALTPVQRNSNDDGKDSDPSIQTTKDAFKLGNFLVDPVSTDFIGRTLTNKFTRYPKPIIFNSSDSKSCNTCNGFGRPRYSSTSMGSGNDYDWVVITYLRCFIWRCCGKLTVVQNIIA